MARSTVVTMYFDLTKTRDRTSATRDLSFYMEHGKPTLALNNPMVIFCDESTQPLIHAIRIAAVPDPALTTYVIKNITDYDFYKDNIDIILENRRGKACYENQRNTASYCILTTFKATALRIAKQMNPYQTPFYAWVDFGASHIVRKFAEYMPKMLDKPRPRVTLCYIHYRGQQELQSMESYLKEGNPCAVAATCFTLEATYVDRFYNAIQSIFHEMLFKGVGHNEEATMVYFHHRYPELCTLYYGDYYSIAENYHEPRADYHAIRWYFIDRCMQKGRSDLAKVAAEAVLYSAAQGWLPLSEEQKQDLQNNVVSR